jgi:DNA-binding CsgD family transcriptional regulator
VDRAGEVAAALPDEQRLAITVRRTTSLIHLGEESGWELANQIPEAPPRASVQDSVVRGHINLADGAILWGRYEEARRRFARVRALLDAEQYPHVADLVRVTEAHLDWFTGNWCAAADILRPSGDADEDRGIWHVEAVLVAARLHTAWGDDRAAERELSVVIDRCRGTTWSSVFLLLAEATAALATIRLARGEPIDALRVTDDATSVGMRMRIWLWATELVPVRLAAQIAVGRVDDAEKLVAAFDDGLGDRAAPAPQAARLLCHAILADALGQPAVALPLYDQAATAWEVLPRPYDALLARERAAACQAAAGRTGEAVAGLREVHRGLTDLGALVAVRRVEGRLRELGAPVRAGARRGRRGYGDELSPRELEVIRHLVLGRSNREIADALSRSPKTVAAQLESARRKLNVTSRTAVAVAAIEAGLVEVPTQTTKDQPPAQ